MHHQEIVSNVHPVCFLPHKTQTGAKIVHWGISPMSYLRQMEEYVMIFVHLVRAEELE